MKQMKTVEMMILGVLFLISVPAFATTQFNQTCPQKFIATVTNIEDVQNSSFPKIEVNFQVIQTIKGEQLNSKKIQIVKNGPIEFKNGEVYTIESRDNWLCSAALFSKI